MSSPFPSTSIHHFLTQVHSRKLLLQTPLSEPGANATTPISIPAIPDSGSPEDEAPGSFSFDANVVMILAILLCALICALGLHSIVRCALRCSSRIGFNPDPARAIHLATAGIRRKALRAIPIVTYNSSNLKLFRSGLECAICLSDLVEGERVRVLPKCNHAFHVRCIDRWLMARPVCPTCRQSLFTTAQKSSGCGEGNRSEEAGAGQSFIVPLEHEGYVPNYRES